jgi:2-hydroxychromene-2-carboxylate isomerase
VGEAPAAAEAELSSRRATFYFDLGSPYAYLAFERAPAVLGRELRLQPVLLGAIFARRGFGSWSATPAREQRVAELEARARTYGLAEFRWPPGWPTDGLKAMRAATWASRAGEGAGEAFARAVFRRQFAGGEDIAEVSLLHECAREAGLEDEQLESALADDEIKRLLRESTDVAWEAGVRGVPSVRVGAAVFYGDDQLELAAAALRAG